MPSNSRKQGSRSNQSDPPLVQKRPDYGIDALRGISNLLIAATVGFGLWAIAAFGLWSGRIEAPIGQVRIIFPVATTGVWSAAGFTFMAIWMLWSSKIGKVRERERLLRHIGRGLAGECPCYADQPSVIG